MEDWSILGAMECGIMLGGDQVPSECDVVVFFESKDIRSGLIQGGYQYWVFFSVWFCLPHKTVHNKLAWSVIVSQCVLQYIFCVQSSWESSLLLIIQVWLWAKAEEGDGEFQKQH
jgi:hypothetical protein